MLNLSAMLGIALIFVCQNARSSDTSQGSPVRINERQSDLSERSDTNRWTHKLQPDWSDTFSERARCYQYLNSVYNDDATTVMVPGCCECCSLLSYPGVTKLQGIPGNVLLLHWR